MFRLIAVTLAALFGILYVIGDEARRPADVARAEPLGFDLVRTAASPFTLSPSRIHVSEISDQEAIDMALAAGKALREKSRAEPRRSASLAASTAPSVAAGNDAERPSYWYVTGSRVNLRGGPGTANAVVGQVTFGTEAEVLEDANGWYRIRLADGSASGWIFGKFLDERRPG